MTAPKVLVKNGRQYILLREHDGNYLYKESISGRNVIFNEFEVKEKLHVRTRNSEDLER